MSSRKARTGGRASISVAAIFAGALAGALAGTAQAQPPAGEPPSPDALWQKIDATRLETERAVEVRDLVLNTGMALFKIERGVVFPTTPAGERSVEMVFQGQATLVLEPPDEIEAGQLDLFTGSRSLEEPIEEAVLVVNLDAATDAIFGRPPAEGLDAQATRRAEETFERWRARPERKLFGVELAIFRDAFGDPLYEGYFAGWFRSQELEDILYLVDPNAQEQVTLGHFTALDATGRQERKLKRSLHRQQRKGRLIGVSIDDLGVWDTWLSAARRDSDGQESPGTKAFEPRHYELDLVIADPRFELHGRTRLYLQPLSELTRIVELELHSDLVVEKVRDGDGTELFFRQAGGEVLAVLPRAPQPGEELVLEVEYAGRLIDKAASKSWALRDTTHWYPHAGTVDLATYDVTLHWPKKLDLIAAGRLVDSGTDAAGRRFERRRLDHRTFAFGFEVGRFNVLSGHAGDVEITLACDATGSRVIDKRSREELLATIADALDYFADTFGPYPMDRIAVVTVPRAVSQSLLGFVTLSSVAMIEENWLTWLFGFEDRRTVVAHEIAHQWWGHVVAWQSYRDQWISEAMANYAALLYARHRLKDRFGFGPTSGWQQELTRTVGNGRPVESLGPLVLGERLASSVSFDAYQSIVYKKGAVVLDMLARAFGEQTFLEILRRVASEVAFRQISTPLLIDSIEQISGRQLDDFAQQFIFGTGLPEVYYSYTFARAADGWRVDAEARQQAPWRYDYRLTERPDGALDVTRRRLDQTEIDDSTLYVPFQVTMFKPGVRQSAAEKRLGLDPEVSGNARLIGHVALTGAVTQFSIPIEFEPKELFLDPRAEVFARFFNERRFPKRMLYYQGLDRAAAGSHDDATELFSQALAAEVFSGPHYGSAPQDEDLEAEGERLDAWIRLQLARLYLDQGRAADARVVFDRLERQAGRAVRQGLGSQLRNQLARLAIQEGDAERAYKELRKPVLKLGARGPVEGLLLLAVAARDAGHAEDFATALDAAIEKGADVTLLKNPEL